MNSLDILDKNLSYGRDIFAQIEGYTLYKAIFTTYSLDAKVTPLLASRVMGIENAAMALRECMEEEALHIFYERGCLVSSQLVSSVAEQMTQFLESSFIHGVKVYKNSFHPKICLLAFMKDGEEKYRYRLGVSSKNLTLSESFEYGVVLEIDDAENPFQGKSGRELLKTTINFVNNKFVDVNYQANIKASAVFKTPNTSFRELIDGKEFNRAEKIFIISPGFMDTKIRNSVKSVLYHRLDDSSHAKIYHLLYKESSTLWLGSANCSSSGLGEHSNSNYECMVKLRFDERLSDYDLWLDKKKFEILENKDQKPYEDNSTGKNVVENIINSLDVTFRVVKIDDTHYRQIFTLSSLSFSEEYAVNVHTYDNRFMGRLQNKGSQELALEFTSLDRLSAVINISVENFSRSVAALPEDDETRALLEQRNNLHMKRLADEIGKNVIEDRTFYGSRNREGDSARAGKSSAAHQSSGDYEKLIKYYAGGGSISELLDKVDREMGLAEKYISGDVQRQDVVKRLCTLRNYIEQIKLIDEGKCNE